MHAECATLAPAWRLVLVTRLKRWRCTGLKLMNYSNIFICFQLFFELKPFLEQVLQLRLVLLLKLLHQLLFFLVCQFCTQQRSLKFASTSPDCFRRIVTFRRLWFQLRSFWLGVGRRHPLRCWCEHLLFLVLRFRPAVCGRRGWPGVHVGEEAVTLNNFTKRSMVQCIREGT